MKKKLLLGVSLLLSLVLVGCGSSQTVQVSATALAEQLSTQIKFEDSLSKLDDNMLYTLYDIQAQDVQQGAAYVSSGATAEEIAVFDCTDSNAAGRVEAALKQRIDNQKQSYVDYVPKEMTKLNDAVLIRRGNQVALCICNDSAAAQKLIQG